MNKEVTVSLTTPIMVSESGELVAKAQLVLFAPFSKVQHHTVFLKQAYIKGLREAAESAKNTTAAASEEAQSSPLTSSQIMLALFSSSIDMSAVMKVFKELLQTPGVCAVFPVMKDTKVWINDYLLGQITADDIELLLGEYLLAFLSGWMGSQNNN